MKDWNIGKWIIRFLILITIFLVYDSIMNILDVRYKEVLKISNNAENEIDTSDFITMQVLGFEYHETTKSNVDKVDIRIDPNGYIYELEMNNNDANNRVSIDLTFYKFSNKEIANESFESLVRILYKNSVGGISCYIGDCVMPDIDFETTIQYMVEIEPNIWNVDKGYALNECFTNEANTIILLKENQIMVLYYSTNSSLNEAHVPTFVNLFDKTEDIFNQYEGE